MIILDYLGGSNVITRGPNKWKGEPKEREPELWQYEKDSADTAGFDNEGRGHEPRNLSSL